MLIRYIVNSVPRFETAWMQRSKFPYTARSSAKVIRHAVSIDERRAKFRSDLISGREMAKKDKEHHRGRHHKKGTITSGQGTDSNGDLPTEREIPDRFRRRSKYRSRKDHEVLQSQIHCIVQQSVITFESMIEMRSSP